MLNSGAFRKLNYMFTPWLCVTECNGCPMICLDLAQYVVHMMPARALFDKL
jgi:hypothetical protein